MEQEIQPKEKKAEARSEDRVVRLLAKDIEGKMQIYPGLTKIKGVSWGFANAVCKVLKLPKTKKIGSLTDEELIKITEFIKNPKIPSYLVNRKKDLETGKDLHLVGSDLELKKEFDIKKLKKIKSYKGVRHTVGLPLRGQRTKAHFRTNRRKGAGIKKKNKAK